MEEINILEEFGLTEKEAKLYLALLELLIKKGLVSYVIKSNIKYFEAVNPEKFLDILKEEQDNIKIKEDKIKEILPRLNKLREINKEKQEANIYSGKKGMKSVFEDTLKENNEILVFGGGGKSKESLGPYYKLWNKIRAKNKIKLKLLWNEDLRIKKDEIKD